MNRIMKFRAWNSYDKEMIYYSLDDLIESVWSESPKNNLVKLSKLWETDRTDKQKMQSTGLLDKTGKNIFEGDILYIEKYSDRPFVVDSLQNFFEDKGYAEGEFCEDWSSKNIEVIGNIYENPNLTNNENP